MTTDMILAIMYYGKTTHTNFKDPLEVEDVLEIGYQLYPNYDFKLKDLQEALECNFDINVTTQHIFAGSDEPANYQDVIDMVSDITF